MDSDSGLYNYGARYYDPSLSLWLGVDPLADQMPGWSPYNYIFNNPVRFIDPDGRAPRVSRGPGDPVKIIVQTSVPSKCDVGHTFVSGGSGYSTILYTYSRYGELGMVN